MALSAIMVISAASIFTFDANMDATVSEYGSVTITVGSITYQSSESFPVNWGTVNPGDTCNQEVTIHNDHNTAVTPSITSTLPSTYGTITLSSTSAIAANSDTTINIVFTVSDTAPAGVIPQWTATLEVTS